MAGRILVLDDEENYASMLQELLRKNNYRVDMATRPERAIDLLEEIPYDLVISDYKMPVMDGAGFLKRTRELYPNLPFILVSGLMNTPELVKMANMSVTLVMEKPLDTVTFLQHVSRFSEPMTNEEAAVYTQQSKAGNVNPPMSAGLPEEPRFISAESMASIQFMHELWACVQCGDHCYLFEPVGGEADLALKDVSMWKGNGDKPVLSFTLNELGVEEGVAKLYAVAEDTESSQIVMVRLDGVDHIDAAKSFAMQVSEEVSDLFITFVVSAADGTKAFRLAAGQRGLVLPGFADRPSDVAHYIQRFLRIASERLDKPKVSELSVEVVYAFLAYQWSSCREIQDVMTQLINETQGGPLSVDIVSARLKVAQAASAAARLATLLAQSQARYLRAELSNTGVTLEALCQGLDLSTPVEAEGGLELVPLLDPNLATY